MLPLKTIIITLFSISFSLPVPPISQIKPKVSEALPSLDDGPMKDMLSKRSADDTTHNVQLEPATIPPSPDDDPSQLKVTSDTSVNNAATADPKTQVANAGGFSTGGYRVDYTNPWDKGRYPGGCGWVCMYW